MNEIEMTGWCIIGVCVLAFLWFAYLVVRENKSKWKFLTRDWE